jgi:hypothetical protein
MAAPRKATSREAREVAHPQLFRSMLKDKPALYFAVKVAHPPPVLLLRVLREKSDRLPAALSDVIFSGI